MKDNTISSKQATKKLKDIENKINDIEAVLQITEEQNLRDIMNRKLEKLRKQWHYIKDFE
jgi:phage shock protein A